MPVINKKNSTHLLPLAISLGVGVSVIISLIESIVGATLISTGRIGESGYVYLCVIVWVTAVTLGCVVSGRIIKEKKYIACIATGLGYSAILTAMQILFFESGFNNYISAILCIFAGVGLSFLLNKDKKRKNKRKYQYK